MTSVPLYQIVNASIYKIFQRGVLYQVLTDADEVFYGWINGPGFLQCTNENKNLTFDGLIHDFNLVKKFVGIHERILKIGNIKYYIPCMIQTDSSNLISNIIYPTSQSCHLRDDSSTTEYRPAATVTVQMQYPSVSLRQMQTAVAQSNEHQQACAAFLSAIRSNKMLPESCEWKIVYPNGNASSNFRDGPKRKQLSAAQFEDYYRDSFITKDTRVMLPDKTEYLLRSLHHKNKTMLLILSHLSHHDICGLSYFLKTLYNYTFSDFFGLKQSYFFFTSRSNSLWKRDYVYTPCFPCWSVELTNRTVKYSSVTYNSLVDVVGCSGLIKLYDIKVIPLSLTREELDCLKYHPAGTITSIGKPNEPVCISDCLIHDFDFQSFFPTILTQKHICVGEFINMCLEAKALKCRDEKLYKQLLCGLCGSLKHTHTTAYNKMISLSNSIAKAIKESIERIYGVCALYAKDGFLVVIDGSVDITETLLELFIQIGQDAVRLPPESLILRCDGVYTKGVVFSSNRYILWNENNEKQTKIVGYKQLTEADNLCIQTISKLCYTKTAIDACMTITDFIYTCYFNLHDSGFWATTKSTDRDNIDQILKLDQKCWLLDYKPYRCIVTESNQLYPIGLYPAHVNVKPSNCLQEMKEMVNSMKEFCMLLFSETFVFLDTWTVLFE